MFLTTTKRRANDRDRGCWYSAIALACLLAAFSNALAAPRRGPDTYSERVPGDGIAGRPDARWDSPCARRLTW